MRKILMAALFFAASSMAFIGCSKDDDKDGGEKYDNSAVQCWEVTSKYSGKTDTFLMWGSGTEVDEFIQMNKDMAEAMGMKGVKYSKKPSSKSEEDCYDDEGWY